MMFAELNQRFNGSGGRLEHLNKGSERVLVAEVDGELVGFACVQINNSACSDSPWAELTELFVDEASRRRGVGAALVSEAERISWKSGCQELVLRTRTSNHQARALFESCGYEEAAHVVYRKRRS
jgi:ribosomal protein S18 acetylase RimI-like enzyme